MPEVRKRVGPKLLNQTVRIKFRTSHGFYHVSAREAGTLRVPQRAADGLRRPPNDGESPAALQATACGACLLLRRLIRRRVACGDHQLH